jgi:hypothetical protein
MPFSSQVGEATATRSTSNCRQRHRVSNVFEDFLHA